MKESILQALLQRIV